jgi:hypothetical protein
MPFVINTVLINLSIHTILEFQVDPLIFDEVTFIEVGPVSEVIFQD